VFSNTVPITKKAIAVLAATLIALALALLLVHYVTAMLQPVRWPTRYYFIGMFFIALCLKQRTSIMLFVFSLPLAPDFHLQLEAVLKPSVTYFVSHPALDLVAGLCLGLWVKQIWLNKKVGAVFPAAPWPLGLLVITLAASVSVAIIRNLEVTQTSEISVFTAFEQLVRFKLINAPNDYLPVVDLLNYCFAILTITLLVPFLKSFDTREREEIIFKPLILSLIASALWGIFQSLSGIGLSEITLDYLRSDFGYGAQGFQPDLHAFAAVMLIGTVGILGFLRKANKQDALLGYVCLAVCWAALILSKSKTSFVLAVLSNGAFMIVLLKSNGVQLQKTLYFVVAALGGLFFLLLFAKDLGWAKTLVGLIFTPESWSFDYLNKVLVYRPELFRAALLMFSDAPIFGVGQGNFFRLSSNIDLSHSAYMVQKGGENAHNYFLQTLAETGLVGASVFVVALSWPFFQVDRLSILIVPSVAIFSVFLGNVFSHSLLVRPNLILLAVFLALLYASVDGGKSKNVDREIS
jgi:O-antigen ligase